MIARSKCNSIAVHAALDLEGLTAVLSFAAPVSSRACLERLTWATRGSGPYVRYTAPMKRYITASVIILTFAACGASSGRTSADARSWASISAPVRFLTSGTDDYWPCFSPDGTRILFSRRMGVTTVWELFVVQASGGEPVRLARSSLPVSATRANWSKENRIAFTGVSDKAKGTLWLINADGSGAHELNFRGLSDRLFYPSWFSDGERLAVMDAGDLSIKRLDLSKGDVVAVTNPKRIMTGMPSVSPDGKWVAFAGQENVGREYDQTKNSIWLVDSSGVLRTVESTHGQGRAPTWSPNGEWLAFESNRASSWGLYAIFVIRPDGTELTQVTDPSLNATHPVWSPDGRQLAFSAWDNTQRAGLGIAIVNLAL